MLVELNQITDFNVVKLTFFCRGAVGAGLACATDGATESLLCSSLKCRHRDFVVCAFCQVGIKIICAVIFFVQRKNRRTGIAPINSREAFCIQSSCFLFPFGINQFIRKPGIRFPFSKLID
ncbi:hypothetical protein QS95_11750 [Pseudomonas fluorescens]|uniref:Uncharacterized protein n=1 Tax=Pseudomonas fluorescens TaxID=294 RepID=A0AAE2DJX2_PSEFL|nr:hypothetical protein QS95_11750 [Pseudomonas fluorescens]